jgi:hypothetical protein
MEAGSRGGRRRRLHRLAVLVVASGAALAVIPAPAFAQDAADASLPPPPLDAPSECAAGGGGSTQGYADASPTEAAELFTDGFPCILDSLANDPPDGGGEGGIDLSLQGDGDGYKPANPSVPLTLPTDLGEQVTVGDRGIAVEMGASDPSAAAGASAAPLAGEGLFYADAAQAEDVFLAPTTTGLATVYQLRGPESPQRLEMAFDLPDGGRLQDPGDGGAQVLKQVEAPASFHAPDGGGDQGTGGGVPPPDEWIGTVSPPQATDANGNPVAATMTVNGDSLELDVPHSDPGIAYPIAVTTAVTAATVVPGFDPYVGEGSTGDYFINQMDGEVVRIDTAWCSISPLGVGTYGAAAINDVRSRVHTVEADGLKPLLRFGTGAPTGAKQGSAACSQSPAIAQNHAGEYGDAARTLAQCLAMINCPVSGVGTDGWGNLVSGYAPGMRGLELGNEPNLATWWCKEPGCNNGITTTDADIYTNAAQSAATKIDNNVPALKTGTAGISFSGPGEPGCWDSCMRVNAWDYLSRMLSQGVPAADAISIHPYGTGLHPSFQGGCGGYCETNVLNDIGGTRFSMNSVGYSSMPIWITEVGIDADYNDNCSSGNPPPGCYNDLYAGSTEQQYQATQLQYIWNTIRYNCGAFNVPLAVFWSEVDGGNPDGPYFAGFMGSPFNQSKAAYQVFTTDVKPLAPVNRTCLG